MQAPAINVPAGGGAIRPIGEKFTVQPSTGTASFSIPIATSPARDHFPLDLQLTYDSGSGNGPFGIGWSVGIPAITRKTDKGVPRYDDAADSDVFILSGAEDLVPVRRSDGKRHESDRTAGGVTWRVRRYRPRTEGLFARIERWTAASGDVHWRTITRDNVTSLYGVDAGSRVADGTRVFSWLLRATHDDRGNAVLYDYKAEDDAGIAAASAHERNRTTAGRAAARYPKRIRYGNRVSRLADPNFEAGGFHFEVVFDYGEHDRDAPAPQEQTAWACRRDPWSTHRSGFEIRSYRLCQRVLMVHHFPGEAEVGEDCVVRSTDFTYRGDARTGEPAGSFLAAVTQRGWRRQGGGYLAKALPPIELEYSIPRLHHEIQELDAASLENLPAGIDGAYQFVDLDGEGSAGILTQQGEAWFYKRNLSALEGRATFGPAELVASRPAADAGAAASFLDLAGDGRVDLVLLDAPGAGFYERGEDATTWTFRLFESVPRVDLTGPNARFIDLDGDGLSDVLLTEDEALVCHRSLGRNGFDAASPRTLAIDDERGPRVVFDDGTQSIYLADMNGDGLADIVRIRRGEVSYWPSEGHGRFGARVAMDGAPELDDAESFDQRRIRLGDVDGSGPADLFYLHRDGARIWRNQSGNSWSAPERIDVLPPADSLASVTVADLLGNGTSCLVWSTPLPGDRARPMRYVDLMGGEKPHLLIGMANNLGSETRLRYRPSTFFYLRDRAEGKPWHTRLPFPVQVVARVETFDRVSGNRFVTRYDYRHGYFDGEEREFRGFGMVEHRDTEELEGVADAQAPRATNFHAASDVPPVVTRTWYHTGAFVDANRLADLYRAEYFRGGADALSHAVLGSDWSAEESRQACRALRGSILRQEIRALDGSPKQDIPYRITENSYAIARLQAKGDEAHAVFHVRPRETLVSNLERDEAGGRMTHTFTLAVDDFGNVRKSVHVAYPRATPDATLDAAIRAEQAQLLALMTLSDYTSAIDEPDAWRAPLPSETRAYQMTGVHSSRFAFEDFALLDPLEDIGYDDTPDPARRQRRLVEHQRILYRANDLSAPLPLGRAESMALPFETYTLAWTPGLLATFPGLAPNALATEGGCLGGDAHAAAGLFPASDAAGLWWTRTGRVFHSPDPAHAAAQELAFARQHFFLTHRVEDAFGNTTRFAWDRDLLLLETRDPLGGTVAAENDFRVVKPRVVTDQNGNRTATAFDVHGRVAGTALMGKTGEPNAGDSLDTFDPDPPDAVVLAQLASPSAAPHAVLGSATTRFLYDLFAYHRTRHAAAPQPIVSAALARETHRSPTSRVQHTFVYSDGLGRELQKKRRAEPGAAAAERWVGSGWTIYNNKGNPVRRYEPFFAPSAAFEGNRRAGVSRILFYDPLERLIGTVHPDHTYEKVVIEAWRETRFDAHDNVDTDPAADPHLGPFFQRLETADYLPTWYDARKDGALGAEEQRAAQESKTHAQTPATVHFDPLGRAIATIQDAGAAGVVVTRTALDIEGNARSITDALGREAMRYAYDLAGRRIRQTSIDAGERRFLHDTGNRVIREWAPRGQVLRIVHDELRRPVETWMRDGAAAEILVESTAFGTDAAAEAANRRGRVMESRDGAGAVFHDAYDFKGNLTRVRRTLAADYRTTPDWSTAPALEARTYERTVAYDALNRPSSVTAPDGSVIAPAYNEANLLERVEASVRGAAAKTTFVAGIDYDAKGQRTAIEYGNGVVTELAYDDETFRLRRVVTRRGATELQHLRYTYDAGGNVAEIADDAQQTIYFAGAVARADARFRYDALHRLVFASGREHRGQLAAPQPSWNDAGRTGLNHPHDGTAMRPYTETYGYDAVGNLLRIVHAAANGNWTRAYEYPAASNRLARTTVGAVVEDYAYDAAGNMTAMSHLPRMRWDHRERLVATSSQAAASPVTTHYGYDASGSRVRKVSESAGPAPRRTSERIYLDGFEVHRIYAADGTTVTLERETLHIAEAQHRFAMVETRTQGADDAPQELTRFQHTNLVGSAVLELDADANVVSYEEYHPHGSTSYQALTVAPKRYRYTGMERDEESGLSYHRARYYAPWIGRWTACDPKVENLGPTSSYAAMSNDPIQHNDPTGTDAILIAFPDYKVDTEIPTTTFGPLKYDRYQELGHAGVVLIDNKTGTTKYYEYGRYPTTDGVAGRVRTVKVPDVVIGKDGKPTKASLDHLLTTVSEKSGKRGRIEGAYIKSDKFDAMDEFAKKGIAESTPGMKGYSKKREPYNLYTHNCGTWAGDVVNQDADIASPDLIVDRTPANVISEYRDEGHEAIDHPGAAAKAKIAGAKKPAVKTEKPAKSKTPLKTTTPTVVPIEKPPTLRLH